MWIQSEDGVLSGLANVMTLGFIKEILIRRMVVVDGVSLFVSEIIQWVYFDVSVDGAKDLLILGSYIIIWFRSNKGNDDGISLGRSGVT